MYRLISISFNEAINTLRTNLFRTLLSTLGIVIGVGALTSILALGDGMERFGREQVASTTSLSTVYIEATTTEEVDGLIMPKEQFPIIHYDDLSSLTTALSPSDTIVLRTQMRAFVRVEGDTFKRPAEVFGIVPQEMYLRDRMEIEHGRAFGESEMTNRDSVVIVNHTLATRLVPDSNHLETILNQTVLINSHRLKVIGISKSKSKNGPVPKAAMPIFVLNEAELRADPPSLTIIADKVENVPVLKGKAEQWLDQHFQGGKAAFRVFTNDFRIDQLSSAILVFKIVMGMIVGIAILVGGIGVMNVLLMSVTERTREIGVRKALGAKNRVIAMQFLAESLAVSLLGSLLGMVLGGLFLLAAVPIIDYFTEVKFPIAFQPSSFLVVMGIAVVIGIVFGTYPAKKASRLSPIDAIRHE